MSYPKGDPENFPTRDELLGKFRRLAGRTLPPGERSHFRQLAENYRRLRQARAALVKLHQRIVAHIDRLETALQLPPPKPASRRRKR